MITLISLSALVWGILYLVVSFVFYLTYDLFLKPLWVRYKYSTKYSNVLMSEKFYPINGDISIHNEDAKRGKVFYQWVID